MALMENDINAGKTTIEELLRNKEAHAVEYKTGPTTARDAARELAERLKAEELVSRSQSPDQERPTNNSD